MTGLNHSTLPVATGVLQHDVITTATSGSAGSASRGEPGHRIDEARAHDRIPIRRDTLPPFSDAVNAAPNPTRQRPTPHRAHRARCRRAVPPEARSPSTRGYTATP